MARTYTPQEQEEISRRYPGMRWINGQPYTRQSTPSAEAASYGPNGEPLDYQGNPITDTGETWVPAHTDEGGIPWWMPAALVGAPAAAAGIQALPGLFAGGGGAGSAATAPSLSGVGVGGNAGIQAALTTPSYAAAGGTTAAGVGSTAAKGGSFLSKMSTWKGIGEGLKTVGGMMTERNRQKSEEALARERMQLERDLADQNDRRARDIANQNTALEESSLNPFRHQLSQASAIDKLDRMENMSFMNPRDMVPEQYRRYVPEMPNLTPSAEAKASAGALKRDVMSGRTAPTMTDPNNYGKTATMDLTGYDRQAPRMPKVIDGPAPPMMQPPSFLPTPGTGPQVAGIGTVGGPTVKMPAPGQPTGDPSMGGFDPNSLMSWEPDSLTGARRPATRGKAAAAGRSMVRGKAVL